MSAKYISKSKNRWKGHRKKKSVSVVKLNAMALEAIENGNLELLEDSIQLGFNVNKTIKIDIDENQYWMAYPLCLTFDQTGPANIKIMHILLRKGVDLSRRILPLHTYEEEGGTISYDQKDTYLHTAIKTKNIDAVRLLLQYGADVNSENLFHTTPLRYAVSFKFWSAVHLLIDYNGIKQTIYDQSIVLRLLCLGQFDIILKLIAAGHDVFKDKSDLANALTGCCYYTDEERFYLNQILNKMASPNSLLQLCRTQIRRQLGRNCKPDIFQYLDLPSTLKDYLSLNIL